MICPRCEYEFEPLEGYITGQVMCPSCRKIIDIHDNRKSFVEDKPFNRTKSHGYWTYNQFGGKD